MKQTDNKTAEDISSLIEEEMKVTGYDRLRSIKNHITYNPPFYKRILIGLGLAGIATFTLLSYLHIHNDLKGYEKAHEYVNAVYEQTKIAKETGTENVVNLSPEILEPAEKLLKSNIEITYEGEGTAALGHLYETRDFILDENKSLDEKIGYLEDLSKRVDKLASSGLENLFYGLTYLGYGVSFLVFVSSIKDVEYTSPKYLRDKKQALEKWEQGSEKTRENLENNPNNEYIYKIIEKAKKSRQNPVSIIESVEIMSRYNESIYSTVFKKVLDDPSKYISDRYILMEEFIQLEKNLKWLEK